MIDLIKIDIAPSTNQAGAQINTIDQQYSAKFDDILKSQINEPIKSDPVNDRRGNLNTEEKYRQKKNEIAENNNLKKSNRSSEEKSKAGLERENKKAVSEKKEKSDETQNRINEKTGTDEKKSSPKDGRDFINTEKINIDHILNGIEQIIDILKNAPGENRDLDKIKDTINNISSELKKDFNSDNGIKLSDKILLKKNLIKIQSMLDSSDFKDLSVKKQLNDIFSSMNNILKKSSKKTNISIGDKNSVHNESKTTEPGNTIANKNIGTISESFNSESSENSSFSSNENNSDNRSGVDLNFLKSSSTAKRMDSAGNTHIKNLLFKEQLQEIINKAKITVIDSKNGTFSLKLYPKELGSVNINLGLEQGVIHGRFLVDNIEAKELLQDNIEAMMEQLEEAGISVGEFLVNVNDQRELFSNEDEKYNPVMPLNDAAADISTEYDATSIMLHDGAINMVI